METAESREVWLGRQQLQVISGLSRRDSAVLSQYFRQSLAFDGWEIQALPWQARHVAVTEHLSGLLTEVSDPEQAAWIRSRLPDYTAMARQLDEVIYAARGSDRVLVNLKPQSQGTAVHLNIWDEPESGAPMPAWLSRNILCDNDAAVPDAAVEAAQGVPAYPAARVFAMTIEDDTRESFVLSLSAESPSTVRAKYRSLLEATGWRAIDRTQDKVFGLEPGAETALVFARGENRCLLSLHPATIPAEVEGEASTNVTFISLATLTPPRNAIEIVHER